MYYADGRSNPFNAGRISLGTMERDTALRRLEELDSERAADFGLIPRAERRDDDHPLTLAEGRRLYEEHLSLPAVAGGVRPGTCKRYRTVLDKFIAFAISNGIETWNQVDKKVLERYAAHLEAVGYKTPTGRQKKYRHKTLHNELTTLKQLVAWLIEDGYLGKAEKINMPLKKAESQRPHCWTGAEVEAIIEQCREPGLQWLGNVVVALACTGLRIGELASLRWSDVSLEPGKEMLTLTDETGHEGHGEAGRRQTKSGRSRSFPIQPALVAVLKRLPQSGTYVFHGPRGGRLKPDTVRNVLIDKVLTLLAERFPAHAGAKGFKDGRLHSFRHYFCSQSANSGVPERMLMQWLGHADSEMVRRYYHLNDEEARRQMLRLDLIGQAGKRFTGIINGTAIHTTEESPSRESS
jgi:integrase